MERARVWVIASVLAAGLVASGCSSSATSNEALGLAAEGAASAAAVVDDTDDATDESIDGAAAPDASDEAAEASEPAVVIINGCRIEPKAKCERVDLANADLS